MRVAYRGHTIEATREPSMTGEVLTFYSVIRESDGFIHDEGFAYDTVRDTIEFLKNALDTPDPEESDG